MGGCMGCVGGPFNEYTKTLLIFGVIQGPWKMETTIISGARFRAITQE